MGCFLERNDEIHDRDEDEDEQETRDLVSESKSSDLALNRLEILEALPLLGLEERFDSKSLHENPVST